MVFVLEIWSPIRPSRVGYIVCIQWYYTTARPAVGPERLSIYILFNCRKGRAGQMKVYRGYCDSRTQYSPTVYGPSRFTAIVVGFFFHFHPPVFSAILICWDAGNEVPRFFCVAADGGGSQWDGGSADRQRKRQSKEVIAKCRRHGQRMFNFNKNAGY